MKRKGLYAVLGLLVLTAALASLVLMLPLVVYVVPEVPEVFAKRLPSPPLVGKGYLSVQVPEGKLPDLAFLQPDLVVYTPLSEVEEGPWTTLQYGVTKSGADTVVLLDDETMWTEALEALGEKPVGILYSTYDSSSSSLVERLSERFPKLVPVPYSGKIGISDRDRIVKSLDSLYAVLVVEPLSSAEAWHATRSRVVMDFRDASGAVSQDRLFSIGLDWNRIVPEALSGESLVPAHYALTVTKK